MVIHSRPYLRVEKYGRSIPPGVITLLYYFLLSGLFGSRAFWSFFGLGTRERDSKTPDLSDFS
jgi:hypothetical protein